MAGDDPHHNINTNVAHTPIPQYLGRSEVPGHPQREFVGQHVLYKTLSKNNKKESWKSNRKFTVNTIKQLYIAISAKKEINR